MPSLRGWPSLSGTWDCKKSGSPHKSWFVRDLQEQTLESRRGTRSPQLTDWLGPCETEMFPEDTRERILWRSQLCTWLISWNFHVTHSSAPGWSFLLCVFFFIGWTFAANGTFPAECWLLGSPCFFVKLNGGGRGKIPPVRSQTSARWVARRGRVVESWLWTSFPLVCAVLWIPLLPLLKGSELAAG